MRRAALSVLVAGLVLSASSAPAQNVAGPTHMRATLDPGFARLGQRVMYRGQVVYPGQVNARWLPPEPSDELTWGEPRAWRSAGPGAETLHVELPLQAFRLGAIPIRGLRFQEQGGARKLRRLPVVTLVIEPVLTAADSNADLRPARGPLQAPWWERVPWRWVVLAMLALAAVVLLVRAWRKRRRAEPAAVPQVLDPAAHALAELEALRALRLPERGEFDAHALRLSLILRRYLEAVSHAPRPGHTTPELLAALSRTPLEPDELRRLGELLRVWDRLKFARAASSIEDSMRYEHAVEALVRRLAVPAAPRAA